MVLIFLPTSYILYAVWIDIGISAPFWCTGSALTGVPNKKIL